MYMIQKKTEQAARFLKPGLSKAAEFLSMGYTSGYDGA